MTLRSTYLIGQRVRSPKGYGVIVWHFPVQDVHHQFHEAYTVQLPRRVSATVFYAHELRA